MDPLRDPKLLSHCSVGILTSTVMVDSPLNVEQVMAGSVSSEVFIYKEKYTFIHMYMSVVSLFST